jgi:hypothetical protein
MNNQQTQRLIDDENHIRKFMIDFPDRFNWSDIYHYELSERFLREFQSHIDWSRVYYYDLSEEFLREFQDRIDFSMLNYYNLSEEFLREFQDRIDLEQLSYETLGDLLYSINININNYPIIENHDDLCGICRDQEGDMYQLPCKHAFHGECIMSWFTRSTKKSCPMCRHVL